MAIQRIHPGPRTSAVVIHGDTVYVGGQVDDTVEDVEEQTRRVLARIDGLLAEAGTDKSKLLSANVWLADVADFDRMNGVWETWVVPGNTPARACVGSGMVRPKSKVEIMVVASRS